MVAQAQTTALARARARAQPRPRQRGQHRPRPGDQQQGLPRSRHHLLLHAEPGRRAGADLPAEARRAAPAARKIGTLKHLPPTLSVQYHFTDLGAFKPYVGAGLNYTHFSSVNFARRRREPIEKNSFGLARRCRRRLQSAAAGYFNVDVKKVQIRTDVSSSAAQARQVQGRPGAVQRGRRQALLRTARRAQVSSALPHDAVLGQHGVERDVALARQQQRHEAVRIADADGHRRAARATSVRS